MPPDETVIPDTRTPPVTVINQPTGPLNLAGSLGLTGWMARIGNLTATAIIAGAFLWLLNLQVTTGRADRLEDRQLFRDSVHEIQREADRRAGEIKGALDGNSNVMRDLIAELKNARQVGVIRPDAPLPKTAPP